MANNAQYDLAAPSGFGPAPPAPSGFGPAPPAPSGFGPAPPAPTSSGLLTTSNIPWGSTVPTNTNAPWMDAQPSMPAANTATSNTATANTVGTYDNRKFGYDPSLGSVNQNTDTVAGQLRGLLSQDSPFITRARTSAAQAANARGLSNSSMAAGAGEAAAIDAATPIAAADAGTYSAQRLANQTATNTANEVGVTEANKAYLLDRSGKINQELEALKARNISSLSAQEANQLQTLTAQKGEIDRQLQAASAEQQSTLQSERFAQQSQLNINSDAAAYVRQQLQGDQAAQLADIEGSNRVLLQSNAGAASLYTGTMGSIASIMGNPDLKPDDKNKAVGVYQDLLRSGLSVIGSSANVDYVSLLNWGGGAPSTTSTTSGATSNNGKINLANVISRMQL